eukprot:XP_001702614.1 predicted protein [Chlamydomonas reinhardtii]
MSQPQVAQEAVAPALKTQFDQGLSRIRDDPSKYGIESLLCSNVARADAEALLDQAEQSGLAFRVTHEVDGHQFGDIYIDPPTLVQEAVAYNSAETIVRRLWWLNSLEGRSQMLRVGGTARVALSSGLRDPDQSFYVSNMTTPNMVFEVLLQLSREARAGAAVHCGAGSGCVSPVMYDHTLWVPVDRLLRGAPWTTRLLACLCLACLVPLYSVLWGGRYALEDVLTGRRRLLDVASAGMALGMEVPGHHQLHVIAANDEVVYVWQFRTSFSKVLSTDINAVKRKDVREKMFSVDDSNPALVGLELSLVCVPA